MMNSRKEYDELFSELKKAGRSPAVRQRTLDNILLNDETETITPKNKRRHFVPAFISFAAVAIAVFLVFSVMSEPSVKTPVTSAFSDLEIERSILAENGNPQSFKATLPLKMNVRSVEDARWNQSVEKTLASLEEVAAAPEIPPAFDLSVYTAEQKNHRFKVWDSPDALFLMDMDSKQIYSTNSEDAANMLMMLKGMYGQ
ncbi:hypothetical protein DHX103_06740 [Planococcus sp. X10-3]|uniref:hypothetical protein n=1 Tax=Planococcus sp. X10-3 TaxID=3061240 RepID=UPI003BB123F6